MLQADALVATAGVAPLAYAVSWLLAKANGPTKRPSARAIALPVALFIFVFVGLLFVIHESLISRQAIGLRGAGPYRRDLDPGGYWLTLALMYAGAATAGGLAHRFVQFARGVYGREP